MNFIRCLNLVSNNIKLNQINEDKIETNKKTRLTLTASLVFYLSIIRLILLNQFVSWGIF